ncbi:MAG: dihydrofolate reductase family protein [Hydrogenothermaceae bacterium]|nr:dihydrofolate reductase family protein [Hydrogenothermaceae bacterium]
MVSIISGVTIDGKISIGRGVSSKDVMPLPLSVRKFLHNLRSRFDGIMVGCNTLRIDNPYLTVEYTEGRNSIRVIPCNKVNFDESLNVFSKPGKVMIVTTDRIGSKHIKKDSVEFIILGR